jgi:hypothetical protein
VTPSSRGQACLLVAVLGGCTCHEPNAPATALTPNVTATTGNGATSFANDGTPHAVVRRQNYRIGFGPYAVEVDPDDGGRIVEFSLDGRSVIVPSSESPEAYASSFWPSPQSAWSWPPPVEFDKLPWTVAVEGKSLKLTSGTSEKLGLSAQQRLTADPQHGALSIEFQIKNQGNSARKVAPWQNTRVRPKGITFYPSHDQTYAQSSLKLKPTDGITWYVHDPSQVKDSLKSYGDGNEGWMAQVDADLLFVKVFPDVPRDAQAPEEGEIVIYVHNSGRFVEMEQQGPYTELAPGQALTWPVQFVLQHIPKNIEVKPFNPQLVELARQMAASVRPRP